MRPFVNFNFPKKSESRIITDDVDYCLNRGLSRISRMTRILRVPLLVVARFIAALSESRIITDNAAWKILTDGGVSTCLSESRIVADFTDDAAWKSVTSSNLLRGQFFGLLLCLRGG